MKGCFSSFFKYFLLPILIFALPLSAALGDTSVRLYDHVPNKAVAKAVFLKKLDTAVHIPLTFILPLRNQDELEELVQRIYDPSDKQHFGKYLTPEEFTERFSPTQEDYDKVIAYAKKSGLSISNTHPNRTLLNVIGKASSIEKAFNLRLYQYKMPDGRKFYAPDENPEVQSSIASIISGIVGLDNHTVWRSFHRRKQITPIFEASHTKSPTFPSGPLGGYSPSDLVTAYNLTGVSANGSGQIIALFELAAYQASDIQEYTNHFNLPSPSLHNVLIDGGSESGIDAEVTLDIELALALAPQSQIYVYEGPNSDQGVLHTYNRIATDNLAKQVSSSWGIGEDEESVQFIQAENAIFLQMAAHGQTIYAAAGDSGAYDDYPNSNALVVDDPASQPYVVGVGGTRLSVNSTTGSYVSESVWNNGLGNGAGGGGVSVVWPIPSWQTNVSTASSKIHRNVPDVSLNADPDTGYSIYYDGQWNIFGGTSCAAPLWAAFTACVNQQRASDQNPVLGFANPSFYSIGASPWYTTNFHDITSGNNLHYAAHTGYDNATGWGTLNGANLFASLTSLTPPSLSPLLDIGVTQASNFRKRGSGTYRLTVSNQGSSATSGTVTVAVTLPNGLTYKSSSAAGWNFNRNNLTFTRSNALNPGASYPSISLQVNIGSNAPRSVNLTATVSGGGSASSTVTHPTTIR